MAAHGDGGRCDRILERLLSSSVRGEEDVLDLAEIFPAQDRAVDRGPHVQEVDLGAERCGEAGGELERAFGVG